MITIENILVMIDDLTDVDQQYNGFRLSDNMEDSR